MAMIFVNLLVQDLRAAREFYGSLGFRLHEPASDEQTAALVVDDTITVMLHTADRFADLVPDGVDQRPVVPAVVHSLTVGSRDEVDDLVARAQAAGGGPGHPPRGEDFRYTAGFADPDGHVWELVWMEPVHVID
jgi:predicted lactoylglutathione lyase